MRDDFGRRLKLDSIRGGERIDLVADEVERKAIAERLGLVSLERLEAHATLDREGTLVRANGRIRALLEQSCVATGEPVAEHVDEAFDLAFLPEPQSQRSEEEIELAKEDCDIVFYDGAVIDFGAAVADTLALAMNPYPRCAGAEAALKEAGILAEEQAGPFAALAKLRKGGNS
jgi:uncharacterized metal-binding protein YceD (DUF177 family)